jgi:hypothetical protein
MTSDLTSQFEKQYAPGWRPAIHESVEGTIIEIADRAGYDDKPYPIIVLRKDSGDEVALHAFHTVLRSKLVELEPTVGDRLAVRYEGRIKSKTAGHKPYHGYSVVHERKTSDAPAEPRDDDIPFMP